MRKDRGEKGLRALMPGDSRGLSNVIVTLIMIVLVLVAVGIIWVSIQQNLTSGTQQIELSSKCLAVNIKLDALNCAGASNGDCDVTFTRNAGGDEIGGVKLVFTDSAATTNFIQDVSGNVAPLQTVTPATVATGLTNVTDVKIVPYFTGASGEEQLCSA